VAAQGKSSEIRFIDRLRGDKVVWIIVLFLCMFSLVSIFSSTSQLATGTMSRIDIARGQLATILLGLAVIVGVYNINSIKVFKLFSSLGFPVSIFLLLLLDLHINTGFLQARAVNGAWRILVVAGKQIHVYEIVKVAMVMYLAWAIDRFKKGGFRFGHFSPRWQKIFYIYLPTLLVSAATLPGSNSSAIFIAGILFLTILIGGMPFKDVLIIGACAVGLFLGCIGIYKATHWEKLERIGTFLSRMDKSVDYEQVAAEAKPGSVEFYEALDKIRQPYGAKIAIKQGGLIGKGPGRSTQKYVVPVMYEDYIFSFLIEEYGLIIGGIFVIFLYISLLARGSIIARNCEGHFAKVSVAGLCVLITGQAMMHILVNCDVGLLTGQTLPLISYGRTSFWCFSLAFGIILSISRMAARRIEKQTREADPLIELGAQSTGDELRDSLGDLDDYETMDREIE